MGSRLGCARVRGIDVLGTAAKAGHWLNALNGALGGVSPISLLDSDAGAQAVEGVLTRIEYGAIS